MGQSLTLTLGAGCRNCGKKTTPDEGQERQICFLALVVQADCGEKLYYCTNKNFGARQDHFVCSTSRLKGRRDLPYPFYPRRCLGTGVLSHMRLTIACVANHEEQFRKAMGAKQKAEAKKELAAKRRQLTQSRTPDRRT